jgi:superfamily I DNA/RNA helicase
LLGCTDADALLAAPVPQEMLGRILDTLFEQPIEAVLQQPDLILAESEDLVRFREGQIGLEDFLLRLDPQQERKVDWAQQGPVLIKGGPGSGKSTLALHRVRALLERATVGGQPAPRILFATFTNTLVTFSRQLLTRLIGPERVRLVTLDTADRLAQRIVLRHGGLAGEIATGRQAREALRQARGDLSRSDGASPPLDARREVLGRLGDDYLLDEFVWIIEGRGLESLDEYLLAERGGRGVGLNEREREAVWALHQAFRSSLERSRLVTYGQVRGAALDLVRHGTYRETFDAVFIDEAQDLTPVALALLVELCRTPEGVCVTADASQSIYARGFRWQQVNEHLRFTGRTVLLKRNYRTTREIAGAAGAFLSAGGAGDADCPEQDHVLSGPKPVLRAYNDFADMLARIHEFLREASRQHRQALSAAAVLVRSARAGRMIAEGLGKRGVPARFMQRQDLDLAASAVKVLTLHAAKGLEFPTVVIASLKRGQIPFLVPRGREECEEEEQAERRLLYVGMTRAMHGLMVLYSVAHPSPFVREFDRGLWNFAEENRGSHRAEYRRGHDQLGRGGGD